MSGSHLQLGSSVSPVSAPQSALDYRRDLPIVGNIESAVDSIATVIAVETNAPLHALAGAELSFDTPPSLAGRHGGGVDRAGDIHCWTIGGDPPTRT